MKSEKGQSMVETALIIPLLMIILFGIVDFGRIFHVYLSMDHAGREGARVASISSEDDDIEKAIIAAMAGTDTSKLNIDIKPEGKANRPSGIEVEIALTYDIDFITPFVNPLAKSLKLSDTTVMRVE
ncbi:hypothetical protein DRW41_22275 [Neobacillus piezotolerans]|uniref:TadE-like domain-containing protein n=1 Tax=Neobacillus piezotolerans TaxID=2259171 RepID=A0A3D8GK80_9BACI|nr:TadE family protein [Neobacillus piezotolerans]RDU34659.1 hypothetical protein DRW41_22275 [Neobacillus piezotolerans]